VYMGRDSFLFSLSLLRNAYAVLIAKMVVQLVRRGSDGNSTQTADDSRSLVRS
jgi:hypothetical protein